MDLSNHSSSNNNSNSQRKCEALHNDLKRDPNLMQNLL